MILNVAAYRFVHIDDVPELIVALRGRAEAAALRGTILVAPEGLNLFLAGAAAALRGFLAWLQGDPRFAGLPLHLSESARMPFARLKVKRKREIIAFRRAEGDPLLGEAPRVAPQTLQRWLRQGCDDDGRRLRLLDTRNREEVAYGSFVGAETLPIDNFVELPEAVAALREAWREDTVVSFCTGGIRCEKAALWLTAQGWPRVYQLDGGILGYFEQVGGEGYAGRCFVFDQRVALDPLRRPLADAEPAA
jgi:UPF0176 protein